MTDASQVKVMESSNRKRERSQEEIDEMNERRAVSILAHCPNPSFYSTYSYFSVYVQVKKAQVDSITAQHDELKQKRVEQAEAR